MLTAAQIEYLETVLGVNPALYAATGIATSRPESATGEDPTVGMDSTPVPILVHTPTLSPNEKTLLAKIMASVKLTDFAHVEDLGSELPFANHTLRFSNKAPVGRSETDTTILWQMPSLTEMLGEGPGVATLKKATWSLLKQLAEELGS